ncbi:hypothetical protein SAMN05216325_10182 [Nitrosomonas marina]|uniref:Uncharacterized protein n=1 Tax=Nitrosomonas marina TaxID=917 RepID=A0A1H8ACM7_9PROT|nr:hypothetical protein SAMN05216325_10182 [Nitrosomonas marina]
MRVILRFCAFLAVNTIRLNMETEIDLVQCVNTQIGPGQLALHNCRTNGYAVS